MRILLVNPFGANWMEGREDRTLTAVRMPPVGILSVAAYLLERGHDVDVLNARGPVNQTGEGDIVRSISSSRPDMVGFTATTSGFYDAYRQAETIKRVFPHTTIVFGGVHVSALREKILESFPCIDFLVTGEGEKAMAALAEGASPETIQGLVFRSGTEVVCNGLRTDLCVLDDLPFPAYRKLEGFPGDYEMPLFNYPRSPGATIISSRGCPYQCSYCDRSVYQRSFRFNSAAYLHEHMTYLKREFNIRHIFFYDDLFTFHRKRIEEFCRLLSKKPLGMTFNCAVRLGHVDDDLLEMLKHAGCWMVSLGIESGDPELLGRHKSNVDLEEMKQTVRQIQRKGLRAKGLFMMGLPGETEESIQRTADFVEELGLDDMNVTKFTPFPGAPIYKTIHDEGVFHEDWELMNCLNFVYVPKEIASKDRLDELYKQFIRRFYTGKNWVRKFGPLMFRSPHSTLRLIKNLPAFLKIKSDFAPGKIH